jgi:hypothetical protein
MPSEYGFGNSRKKNAPTYKKQKFGTPFTMKGISPLKQDKKKKTRVDATKSNADPSLIAGFDDPRFKVTKNKVKQKTTVPYRKPVGPIAN